jgi:hypothetical protein
MEVVYHIRRYLKSSLGKGLLFSRHDHLKVKTYVDGDWAGSIMDQRSTSGVLYICGR